MRGRGGCGISHVLDFPHEPRVRRVTQEARGPRLISTPTPSRLRCGGLISCFAEQTITIHTTRGIWEIVSSASAHPLQQAIPAPTRGKSSMNRGVYRRPAGGRRRPIRLPTSELIFSFLD